MSDTWWLTSARGKGVNRGGVRAPKGATGLLYTYYIVVPVLTETNLVFASQLREFGVACCFSPLRSTCRESGLKRCLDARRGVATDSHRDVLLQERQEEIFTRAGQN